MAFYDPLYMEMNTNLRQSASVPASNELVVFKEIAIADIEVGERIRQDPMKGIDSMASLVKAQDLLQPIVVRPQQVLGKISYVLLAGERRLEAFKKLGRTTIPTQIRRAAHRDMAIDFTKSPLSTLPDDFMTELVENLGREGYTEVEWAFVQRKMRQHLEQYSQQGHRSDLKSKQSARAQEQFWNDRHGLDGVIGKALGVSHTKVRQRDKVLKWLEKYPTRYAGLRRRLYSNQIAISSAYAKIDRDIKKRRIMSRAPRIKLPPEQFQLHPYDFSSEQALKLIPPNSIDCIFTDPPFNEASIALYAQLAKFGAHVLRPGGCLITYAGQYYFPKVTSIFDQEKSLRYHWLCASPNTGHNARIYERKMFACYKPLLMYVKGTKPTCDDFMPDIIGPKLKAPSKILHHWEQSVEEAEHFIKYRSYEGQIVLDPMLGTGTTAIAALKHNRNFIGFEKNPDTLKIAYAKIGQWLKENGHFQ